MQNFIEKKEPSDVKSYPERMLLYDDINFKTKIFERLIWCYASKRVFKGTVRVISSDPPCKVSNARFT